MAHLIYAAPAPAQPHVATVLLCHADTGPPTAGTPEQEAALAPITRAWQRLEPAAQRYLQQLSTAPFYGPRSVPLHHPLRKVPPEWLIAATRLWDLAGWETALA